MERLHSSCPIQAIDLLVTSQAASTPTSILTSRPYSVKAAPQMITKQVFHEAHGPSLADLMHP